MYSTPLETPVDTQLFFNLPLLQLQGSTKLTETKIPLELLSTLSQNTISAPAHLAPSINQSTSAISNSAISEPPTSSSATLVQMQQLFNPSQTNQSAVSSISDAALEVVRNETLLKIGTSLDIDKELMAEMVREAEIVSSLTDKPCCNHQIFWIGLQNLKLSEADFSIMSQSIFSPSYCKQLSRWHDNFKKSPTVLNELIVSYQNLRSQRRSLDELAQSSKLISGDKNLVNLLSEIFQRDAHEIKNQLVELEALRSLGVRNSLLHEAFCLAMLHEGIKEFEILQRLSVSKGFVAGVNNGLGVIRNAPIRDKARAIYQRYSQAIVSRKINIAQMTISVSSDKDSDYKVNTSSISQDSTGKP